MKELAIAFFNHLVFLTPRQVDVIKKVIALCRVPDLLLKLLPLCQKRKSGAHFIHAKKRTIRCAFSSMFKLGGKNMSHDYALPFWENQEEVSFDELVHILHVQDGLLAYKEPQDEFFKNNSFNFLKKLGVYHG